ncbi:hypothetical protein DPMN_041191 [Dreissena polymorpha]|uniref:Uncharacterized protein n=1 Tax=Dreissena polymorpha TaxID=45954 RepID=A0A9D4CXC4_DREPO|nr:hypothetical protein DPMN_041191 [Dreissena polymorpha]
MTRESFDTRARYLTTRHEASSEKRATHEARHNIWTRDKKRGPRNGRHTKLGPIFYHEISWFWRAIFRGKISCLVSVPPDSRAFSCFTQFSTASRFSPYGSGARDCI